MDDRQALIDVCRAVERCAGRLGGAEHAQLVGSLAHIRRQLTDGDSPPRKLDNTLKDLQHQIHAVRRDIAENRDRLTVQATAIGILNREYRAITWSLRPWWRRLFHRDNPPGVRTEP